MGWGEAEGRVNTGVDGRREIQMEARISLRCPPVEEGSRELRAAAPAARPFRGALQLRQAGLPRFGLA